MERWTREAWFALFAAARYPSGVTKSAIEQMSWEEKLRTLEELWDSIAREGDRSESPPWHEQALKETQERYESGAEQPVDWADAKRDLRK